MRDESLDLARARHALEAVEGLKDGQYGNYVSYVRALPATILQNGLGQALAMLLAQGKGKRNDPHVLLHDQISNWLTRDSELAPYRGEENLIAAIVRGGEAAYLSAHAETLAYLEWLKKLAVARLTPTNNSGRL